MGISNDLARREAIELCVYCSETVGLFSHRKKGKVICLFSRITLFLDPEEFESMEIPKKAFEVETS